MDIQKLMKQAQEMQAGMQKTQEELAAKTVESSVGGGKVTVIATGAGDIQSISIDPSVVDASDVEFLEELILSGVQEAASKGKEMAAQEMSKLTGGMGLPGICLLYTSPSPRDQRGSRMPSSA